MKKVFIAWVVFGISFMMFTLHHVKACEPSSKKENPYYEPVNGCGPTSRPILAFFIPDSLPFLFDFHQACNHHDACYMTVGTKQAECDEAFLKEAQQTCTNNTCKNIAQFYYKKLTDSTEAAAIFKESQAKQLEYEKAKEL